MALHFPPCPPEALDAVVGSYAAATATSRNARTAQGQKIHVAGPIPLVRYTLAMLDADRGPVARATAWRFLVLEGDQVVETADVRRVPRYGHRLVAIKSDGANRWHTAIAKAENDPATTAADFAVWGVTVPELGLSFLWLRSETTRNKALFLPVRSGTLARTRLTSQQFRAALAAARQTHRAPTRAPVLVPAKLPSARK